MRSILTLEAINEESAGFYFSQLPTVNIVWIVNCNITININNNLLKKIYIFNNVR